ncbi:SLC25A22.2 family protein [Megaselia abdita]
MSSQQEFHLLPKIINGGIAGIMGVSCVFPLDLVKTRLQNQPIGPNGEKMYSSIFDALKKIIKSEGYFGMYRGSLVNIILITPEKAVKLAGNDYFRYFLTTEDGRLSIPRQMVAGGAAAVFQMFVTTPMELLKIQMQDAGRAVAQAKLEGKTIHRKTSMELAAEMVKTKGILGLYKGLGATGLRDVTFSMIYFPLFAFLNEKGPRREGSIESVFYWAFLSGLCSGAFCAFIVTPLDVIKTRLQAMNVGDTKKRGFLDVVTITLKNEGSRAFFNGGLCRVMVLAPLFGIAQMVYYLGVAERLLSYI